MMMVFLVLSLLLILLVLGILLLLTAVILIKVTTTVVPDSVTAGAIHVNHIESNISQLVTTFGQQHDIFKKDINQIESNIFQLRILTAFVTNKTCLKMM